MNTAAFDIQTGLTAGAVFLQGLLSFFSPCVLPLLPVYFAYLSGGAVRTDADGVLRYDRKKVFVNTVFFVFGIAFAFFLLGLGMSAIGMFFSSRQLLFARIGGVIVILFGLYQLGAFGQSSLLAREKRLPLKLDGAAMSPLTALAFGFVFSFAWTPCVGPVLSSVLLMAASSASRAGGFLLIGVYTLGFALPFLAAGIFASGLIDLFKKHAGIVRYTVKIGGVLLILLGLLMLTGRMNVLSSRLAAASTPSSGTEITESAEPGVGEETDAEEASVSEENTGAASSEDEPLDLTPEFDFELYDQYGNLKRLSDYKGKVVFLNFWATWCPPCRAEMPDIQKLYEKYQKEEDPEVVILGVASPGYGSEQDEEGIKAFLDENAYTYPVCMDHGGEVMRSYYVSAFPTTFMITRDGYIYGYVPGSLTEEIMQDIIDQTLSAGE